MEDIEGFQNWLRLNLLLNEGCHVVRQIFRDEFRRRSGGKWQDCETQGAQFVATVGKKCFDTSQKIQKNVLKSGDVDTWDIPLLAHVLSTMDFGTVKNSATKTTGEKNKPEGVFSEKYEFKGTLNKINDLKNYRHKLAHVGDLKKSVSSADYPDLWFSIQSLVLELGGDPSETERIRSSAKISGIEFKARKGSSQSKENTEKARELKESGNLAVGAGDFEKALRIYTQALNLVGVSDVEKGILYSNRSHTHLQSLKLPSKKKGGRTACEKEIAENCKAALEDAKMVMDLRPNWWKGYVRAAQVYEYKKEWRTAIVFYNQALALSPTQQDVENARDGCRLKARKDEIQEHLDPLTMPRSRQEALDKIRRDKDFHPSAENLVEMNKMLMKSKDPKLVAHASVFFAHHHLHGIDVPLNYEMAAKLFAKGAKEGNAEGMYNLGMLYQNGQGVKQDFQQAIKLFEEAAALPPYHKNLEMLDVGVSASEYALAKCYEDGTGKPIDHKMAAYWYKRSSEHGCGNADNNLAFMYSDGRGVERDMERAIQYWKLGASRENVLAMETLGWTYLGRGEFEEAEEWFSRAVEGGNMNAIMNKSRFEETVAQMKLLKNEVDQLHTAAHVPAELSKGAIPDNFEQHLRNLQLSSLRLQAGDLANSSGSKKVNKEKADVSDNGTVSVTQLTDPKRLEAVLQHRRFIKESLLSKKTNWQDSTKLIRSTATPLHDQRAPPSLAGLKEITLNRMHPAKDHVYEGRILSLIIIEDPILHYFTSIHTVVRDDNWDVQRAYFYKIEEQDFKKFLVGTRLSVVNPYFRLTKDSGSAIRVDDPHSIIFQSIPVAKADGGESMCRFCGKKNPMERCAKCKRVAYCGRDCQTQDWKILKHKLVCHAQLQEYL